MPRKKPAAPAPEPAVAASRVSVILDQSGSMENIRKATIDGFNEYLQSLKETDPALRFSLTLFDTQRIETPSVDVPVGSVVPLTNATYAPRAFTPLYDAVCTTLLKLEASLAGDVTTPVLVVIITNGEENSSHRYNLAAMKEMIARLTAKGNWTFAYQGANVDTWTNAQSYGVPLSNAQAFVPSQEGVAMAYASTQSATRSWHATTNPANYAGGTTDPLYQGAVSDFFEPPDAVPSAAAHPTILAVPPPQAKTRKRADTTIK